MARGTESAVGQGVRGLIANWSVVRVCLSAVHRPVRGQGLEFVASDRWDVRWRCHLQIIILEKLCTVMNLRIQIQVI